MRWPHSHGGENVIETTLCERGAGAGMGEEWAIGATEALLGDLDFFCQYLHSFRIWSEEEYLRQPHIRNQMSIHRSCLERGINYFQGICAIVGRRQESNGFKHLEGNNKGHMVRVLYCYFNYVMATFLYCNSWYFLDSFCIVILGISWTVSGLRILGTGRHFLCCEFLELAVRVSTSVNFNKTESIDF